MGAPLKCPKCGSRVKLDGGVERANDGGGRWRALGACGNGHPCVVTKAGVRALVFKPARGGA